MKRNPDATLWGELLRARMVARSLNRTPRAPRAAAAAMHLLLMAVVMGAVGGVLLVEVLRCLGRL